MAADLEGVTHGVNGSSGVHLHRRHHDLKSPKSNGNMLLGEQIDQKKTTTRQLLCSGKGSTQLLLLLLAAVLLFNLIMPDAANPDPVNNTNNNATKMNFDQSKSEQSRITSTDNKEKRRDSPIEILASNKGEEEEEEGGPILFESSQHFLGDNLQSIFEGDSQQHEQHEKGEGEDVLGTPRLSPGTLQEPLLGGDLSNGHKHSKQSSRYSSGHFDRGIKKEMADIVEGISRDESSHVGFNADVTPNAIYKSLTSPDQVDIKWYHRVWRFLPIKPSWDLIVLGWRSTTSCCNKKSDFKTMSCGHKTWFVLRRTLAIFINLLSIYVAIVCCGATYQIKVTKAKLPYINEVLYEHINEGPVCAFDYKCGTLKTFPNELTSNLANATISHCGACASCSSWNDLELQWSTKDDLSEKAQKCGTKTMFKGIDALQDCLEEDIGWTEPCARCWAEDIVCSKR
mmetsp:Transcript_2422/g.5122  ORF Transcript_2422/g.5122 Transcript_2422/m.5122 type:complete len:455 (+) Transcript_2422:102-1466(+)